MKEIAHLFTREKDTHKGNYGSVLIIGGSTGLTGAVCLCACACLRVGAGVVRVGVPKSLNNIFEIKLTEVMSIPLPESEKGVLGERAYFEIKRILNRIDVLAIGPGISTHHAVRRLVIKILRYIDKPVVLDADGINVLAQNIEVLNKRRAKDLILTPHLGEFSRLINISCEEIKKRRKLLVKEFSRKYNLIFVLKGNRTIISDGVELFENKTGNPGMATAGSGDVLTGIISGLLAQGIKPIDAARWGVYLHGLAGDWGARNKTEPGLIAGDIVEYLPVVLKYLRGKIKPR